MLTMVLIADVVLLEDVLKLLVVMMMMIEEWMVQRTVSSLWEQLECKPTTTTAMAIVKEQSHIALGVAVEYRPAIAIIK